MQELSEKIRQASWSYRFASSVQTRRAVIRTMRDMVEVLPTDASRQNWREIADRLSAAPVDEAL